MKIPKNEWIWSIIEFDGVGRMPSNKSVSEFCKIVNERPYGLIMDWEEILKFAGNLEYTMDCLIVAVSHTNKLEIASLMSDDFHQCEVAIRAIDSTVWVLSASNKKLLNCLKEIA